MLDPDVVLSTLITALKSNADLVAALGSADYIIGHEYLYGSDNSVGFTLYQLPSPCLFLAYEDMLGGNFSGETVWKHRIRMWIKPKNAAHGNNPVGCSPPHLFWLAMHQPVTSVSPGTLDIRTVSLMTSLAPLDAMPSLTHQQDETAGDLFTALLVFPELGDD